MHKFTFPVSPVNTNESVVSLTYSRYCTWEDLTPKEIEYCHEEYFKMKHALRRIGEELSHVYP